MQVLKLEIQTHPLDHIREISFLTYRRNQILKIFSIHLVHVWSLAQIKNIVNFWCWSYVLNHQNSCWKEKKREIPVTCIDAVTL